MASGYPLAIRCRVCNKKEKESEEYRFSPFRASSREVFRTGKTKPQDKKLGLELVHVICGATWFTTQRGADQLPLLDLRDGPQNV